MFRKSIIAAALLLAPVSAQAQNLTLEQRVERMEAEAEIRQVLIEYGAYLDGRDYAAYADLFAQNGVWVGGFGSFTGPAAIRQMLETNLGPAEPGFINKSSYHMMTNPLIEIDGDRAQVTSKYLFWTRSPEDRPVPSLAGRYVDEFVRQGGRWKIARRTTWGEIPFRDPNVPPEPGAGPPAALPSVGQLDARLRRAEDQLAIQRVITNYSAFLDARDYDGYVGLFTEDGVWQNGPTVRAGRGEIRAMLTSLFGEPTPGFVNLASFHQIGNFEIDVEGDTARAKSRFVFLWRGEGGAPTPALSGQYHDELVRVDGAWKIKRRVDNTVMPTREEWVAEIARRGLDTLED